MRAIFCNNFEYEARQSDLERLFRKYGKVDRVDMKSGFAFIYMEDERDAEDAIRGLDRVEFGRKGRRLRVEWTKVQERGGRRLESSRRPAASSRPSKTLFVINFDPYHTRTRDLERHFDPYGKILNIRIRRNFAFIQYESEEDATKAFDATNMSKLMDRVINVEYAIKDDDDRRTGYSLDRTRDRSSRRGYDRGRSPEPNGRERASPDYGHGLSRGGGRSRSPYGRDQASPDYRHGPRRNIPSPNGRERRSDYARGRSSSPRKKRDRGDSHDHTASPRGEKASLENDHGPSPSKRVSPDYASPAAGIERSSSAVYRSSRSPDSRPAKSLRYDAEESPSPARFRSCSPQARERSRS